MKFILIFCSLLITGYLSSNHTKLKQRKVFLVHGTLNACKNIAHEFPDKKYTCIETGAHLQSLVPIEE